MKNCCLVLLLAAFTCSCGHAALVNKRVLPTNKNCDPDLETCRKGDWIDESIADCKYETSFGHWLSCDAQNDYWSSWIVDEAVGDRCQPVSGTRFRCGASGTNTRCVCSDTNLAYNPGINTCRCQYWPSEDVGAQSPAFCTGYYTGGTSSIHHWACCNNCNDPTGNTCDANTWQGGSSNSYCSNCGQNTGGGRVKYYFNCGNCDDQHTCSDRCGGFFSELPGLCWKWLDCFKGCCLAIATQPRNKRDVSAISFCGDGTCSGTETPGSCPEDCCYKMNEVNCTQGNNCSPQCCSSPNCCLDTSDTDMQTNGDSKLNNTNLGIVLLAVCTLIVTFSISQFIL